MIKYVRTISIIIACIPVIVFVCGIIEIILFNSFYLLLLILILLVISVLIPLTYIIIKDISFTIEDWLNEKIRMYNYKHKK